MGYLGVITHLLTFDPNFLEHPTHISSNPKDTLLKSMLKPVSVVDSYMCHGRLVVAFFWGDKLIPPSIGIRNPYNGAL